MLFAGEGWHNNHHRYPASARIGLRWYEIDFVYWMLKLLAITGLIWDLRDTPEPVRQERRETPTCVLP